MSLLNHHAQRQSQDMAPRGAQPPTQVFNAGAEKSNSIQQVLRGTQHSRARASVRLTRLGELAQSLHLPPAHWTQGNQTSCHLQASTAQPLREHRPGRAHENAHRYSIKPFRNFYLHPLEFSKTPAADPKLRRGDRTRSSPTLAQHFPAMSETIRGFPAPDFLDSKLSTYTTSLWADENQKVERGSQFPSVNAQRDWRYQPTAWRD